MFRYSYGDIYNLNHYFPISSKDLNISYTIV